VALVALAAAPGVVRAQFSSGSTGSDGALNLTTPGTVIFDPVAMGLNPAGDNVFNFTTINIGPAVTVVMKSSLLRNRAVVWLATGNVTITGTVSLDGADGAVMNPANPGLTRSPSEPGPGGFPGGVGGFGTSPATDGGGFGGGKGGTALSLAQTGNGTGATAIYSYNNSQLTPLYGGSGGGGGYLGNGMAGGNGGAGGGAIRIVSSTSIAVNGLISADGGNGNSAIGAAWNGGGGSSGVIHLIAPTITGTGTLRTQAPTAGITKLSTSNNTFTGGFSFTTPIIGGLYNPPLPAGLPSVTVVSVAGVNAPGVLTASYLVPDFTINSAGGTTVNIAAQNVPTGTAVKLYLTAEQGADQAITCAPLAGTIASSTASCTSVTFPPGITITDIRAVW